MMRKKMKQAVCILLAAVFAAALTGCAEKEESKVSEETIATAATEAITEPAVTSEESSVPEPLPPVEYPCEYAQEELHCTYDDKDIFGTLYTPDNGREKHPAVILSHGYNCIGADMQDMAKRLASNGVSAYTFDFCGGSTRSASSGESVDMSIETEQDNLRHVIDMISQLDSVDSGNIYLYGESQGGFVSALTGAEMPDRIAGMFLIYPAFCIVDQWLAMDPATMTEPFNFMGGMKLSKTFYDGVPRYDIYEHISAFDNPVIIYHGDKDAVVNLSYAYKIDEAFPDSSLTVVEGAGHGFGGKDRKLVLDGVSGFFTERGLNR
ncbi:MAG: alpha/beta hydrolase family protein [Oscillospiraceae bacterium]